MSTLLIPYQSDDFPPSLIKRFRPELKVDWSDLLWSALTVGRASWADAFWFRELSNRRAFNDTLDKPGRIVEHRPPTAHRKKAVNRSDLVARIAARSSLSRADAATAVTAVVSVIADALARSEDVNIAGFGKFGTRDRSAHRAQSPDRRGGSVLPPAGCRPSRPARLFASRSAGSIHIDVARLPPLATPTSSNSHDLLPRHRHAFAAVARRCTGVESQPLPRRLRLVGSRNPCSRHRRTESPLTSLSPWPGPDRPRPRTATFGAESSRRDSIEPSQLRSSAR